MSLAKQVLHIFFTFGPRHTLRRITQALKAKANEWARTRRHKSRVRQMGEQQTVILTCIGKRFELKLNDLGLHRDLIADRIREPVATSLMLRYANETDILLDAGANIGYFSILLSDKCQKVYAIEPDASNYTDLKKNIELNKTENIRAFNLAFSDKSETLHLHHSRKSNWHTTSKNPAGGASQVQAMTVDEFCRKQRIAPTILKMDIEGFEKHVIPGAKKTLPGLKALFFELHSTALSLEETNQILDVVENSDLRLEHIIRYDRPGLWKEEPLSAITAVRKGDYGIYELIYINEKLF